jgi:hypothetical protein
MRLVPDVTAKSTRRALLPLTCRAELHFQPLRQFLVAFRDFIHHPLSLRIAECLGDAMSFAGAASY